MLKTIGCADMDAFFVSAEVIRRPELAGKPVVVGGSVESRGVVASASYEARKYGVRSAMPMGQALRLCPQLIRVNSDHDHYQALSRRVMAILQESAREVEVVSIDEAYLDLSDLEDIPGGALGRARQIKEWVRGELSLPMTIGLGSNKMVAKVACSQAKPDGLQEVPAGQEARFLAPLPVGAIPGIGPKTSQRLEALGIHLVEELAQVPERRLRAEFGPVLGALLHRWAQGLGSDRLETRELPKSISRETTFIRDVDAWDELVATLKELGGEVGSNLRSQGLMAGVVDLKLRYADFSTINRQATLFIPTDEDGAIVREATQLLREEWRAQQRSVRLLGMGVTKLAPLARQLLLFAEDDRYTKLQRALDEIRRRLGPRAIVRGQVLPPDQRKD